MLKMIERKIRTKKAMLFYELCEMVWKGKQLTYIDGIGITNVQDNQFFLDYIDWINSNNYIDYVSDYEYTRKNKLMERWTMNDIKKEINKVKRILSVYEKMNDYQRKVLAIGVMIKHNERIMNNYDNALLTCKPSHKHIYIEAKKRCQETIERLNNILVSIQTVVR